LGETLRREFSMSPVDTGQTTPPVAIPQPPMSEQANFPPGLLTAGAPVQIPGMPIHRPSFIQAFLANLGPALATGLITSGSQGEQNFATGLAGGLAGIQSYQEKQFERAQQIQAQQRAAAAQQSSQALQAAQTQNLNQEMQIRQKAADYFNPTAMPSQSDVIGAIPPQPGFMQDVSKTRAALGRLSPDEEAEFGSAVSLAARTQDPSPLNNVVSKIVAARKRPEGEQLLGERVAQLNEALGNRYQVLNPGKPLPRSLTLPADATQKDFDRVDKLMESQERAVGTQAQQQTANAIRQQTFALAQQSAEDRRQQQDLVPVIGQDPKTGKDVLVSSGEAKQMGLTGAMKADAADVSKAQSARHWINLADKPGATPDQMGILQLIDKMGKKKLGVVASRWNDFMAGNVGAGDDDYTALRTKMGLSSTLLMNAHVGARGGSYLMEHFENLANAGKMNAQTLKSGILSELDYVKDRAMLPERAGARPSYGSSPKARPPAGATMQVMSRRDGQLHWSDGMQDLGPVVQ
jgi:hypothetical protein